MPSSRAVRCGFLLLLLAAVSGCDKRVVRPRTPRMLLAGDRLQVLSQYESGDIGEGGLRNRRLCARLHTYTSLQDTGTSRPVLYLETARTLLPGEPPSVLLAEDENAFRPSSFRVTALEAAAQPCQRSPTPPDSGTLLARLQPGSLVASGADGFYFAQKVASSSDFQHPDGVELLRTDATGTLLWKVAVDGVRGPDGTPGRVERLALDVSGTGVALGYTWWHASDRAFRLSWQRFDADGREASARATRVLGAGSVSELSLACPSQERCLAAINVWVVPLSAQTPEMPLGVSVYDLTRQEPADTLCPGFGQESPSFREGFEALTRIHACDDGGHAIVYSCPVEGHFEVRRLRVGPGPGARGESRLFSLPFASSFVPMALARSEVVFDGACNVAVGAVDTHGRPFVYWEPALGGGRELGYATREE